VPEATEVIVEVDEALRALVTTRAGAAAGEALACSFEPPSPEWSQAITATTLNLFLLEVRENLEARPGDWADVRDGEGKVVARQPPVRRYDLCYLVSAWGGSVEAQHRALSALLAAVPAYDSVPFELLTGTLAQQELSVRLRVAQQDLGVSVTDVWSSLGQPPRASLSLVVTAPLLPELVTDLAPPADSLDIGLDASRPRRGRAPVPHLAGVTPTSAHVEPVESATPGTTGDEPAAEGEDASAPPLRWTKYRVRERVEED
jgi:hypothetical protein